MDSPRLAQLSPDEKRALLARLLQRKLGKAPTAAPLSAGQRALWFLHRLDPESAAYNLNFCGRLHGPIDEPTLRRALQSTIDRHACLRSTFLDRPDGPVQLVYETAEPALDIVDAAEWTDDRLQSDLLTEAHRPFSLEKGPVFRTRLYICGPGNHVVLLTVHHIVSDFWTLGVLIDDLSAALPAAAAGDNSPRPAPACQYADFVRWQADLLTGPEGQRLWDYWRNTLAGELPTLNLPADRPRPLVQSDCGATIRFRISQGIATRLRDFAKAEGTTLFAVLLAGYQALLHRLTGQDDILVGSPVAGRSRPEFAGLVGYCVNMIVLRADLRERPSFRSFLGQVRQTALDGLRHGDFPFALLVERLQPARDLSRHSLFQAAFVLNRSHSINRNGTADRPQAIRVGDVQLDPIELDQQAVPFDCNMMVEDTGADLACALQYNTDLFDAATIERWIAAFRVLLAAAVEDADRPIAELPLLTDDEQSAMLELGRGRTLPRPETPLHRLIEAQVQRKPAAIAVQFEDRALTYDELNRQANRLARFLRRRGAKADVPIAVCLERSTDMVLALLAILKSGAAYVPLDPDLPVERLEFLLADLSPPVVMTHERHRDLLPKTPAAVICIDADAGLWSDEDAANLSHAAGSDDLAYIIYTSGSTGQPKGCANTHRGIVNRLLWMQETYDLGAPDRVLQKTPYSFDVSVWEFFWPLMTGARLVVARPGGHRDPDYLAQVIAAERITVVHFVPSMLQVFLRAPRLNDCTQLRDVICSGEALSWSLQQEFFGRFPQVRLHNLYGPTEAAVDVTAWHCDAVDPRQVVPIGRPVSNTQVYVLDAGRRPAPLGIPGEVYLGGVQLARGYWRSPQLTADRFVPSPFEPGQRLYRTGDLGMFRPGGVIEYLGRLDHQVKIRGFRIELGEIEASLLQHPDIAECVVIARADGGPSRLVAYLVFAPDRAAPNAVELRNHLSRKLPEFMIPAQFVALTELPHTASGKVDRRALPQPDTARPDLGSESEYEEPRTPTEIKLAAIWADVLHLDRIGARDGFFDLGGHSLLATQVLSRVRADFGIELPLRRFFESPALADLAAAIDEHTGPVRVASLSTAPLKPAPRDAALPMSYGQETLWFLDQLSPGNTTYNVPAAVRMAGPLNFEALRGAFEAIVHRHESLRSTFTLDGEQRVVRIVEPQPLPLEVVDLREMPAAEREAKAKELTETEASKPFNLASGPLLRLAVLRLADLDQIVLMTVHHIAFDGWSTGVLVSEFAALYRGLDTGEPATLSPLPIQFPDLAYWQRQWMQSGLLDGQLEYWKEKLREIPPLLALPTDRPRPHVWSFRGATHPLKFPPSLVSELRSLGKREGCTLFMTLLSAFQTLLYRHSGMDDVCVGSPIANRNRVEVEGLIGFVVNTLVLRGNLSGNPTFTELMRRTREMSLAAYAHQDLPFERIMQAVNPHREARHSSLFQVLFVLQNAPVHIPPLPNLTPRLLLDAHNGTAKFDLTLGLTEMPEGLVGIFEYNCDLFDAATIERLASQFHRLLEEIVADPSRPIAELPLLSGPNQARILALGEGPRIDEPLGCFHHRFERHAAATPDTVALVWGETRLSYAELNARANQLAHELRDRGIGPETIVALCFERSIEMVVATLAVFKAGGAYVPLDPALPRERIAVIVDDARPAVMLTQQRLASDMPLPSDRILALDDRNPRWIGRPTTNPAGGAAPHHLAYIIYTSGSTGIPKACLMQHASVDNAFLGWEAAYDLSRLQSYLQMANFAFDVFTADLVRALGSGGKLVLCPTETLLDPEKLLALVRTEEIHYAEFVPAVIRPLLRHLEATRQNLRPVQLVVVGSDVWYGGEYRRLRRIIQSHARLVNSYGLTEATIDNMYFDGSDEGLYDEGPIPIGRPYANQRACVLDSSGRLQPIGVPGELHIGGTALARGYLNRPELTAEKFIADPFHPGERLYRSGDLARMLPNGDVELLGRTDLQVKIRGFRIELGEVESTLTQHAAVKEAVVVARDDGRGIKRLIAYVVFEDGADSTSASDLRSFLGGKLPDYMVPAVFVPLDAVPLSANGKVDRNALPAPEAGRGELSAEFVPPQTNTEIRLAALWSDVLRIERVGLRDSFFELGGHSLLATQVLARVRADFGVELPLRRLFELPVLADFAAAIDAAERARHGPVLEHRESDGGATLSYSQQRLWFLDQLEPGNPAYHVSTAVRLDGSLDRSIWERCFLEIGARHDLMRTSFPAVDGRPLAVVSPTVSLNVRDVDLSHLPPGEREERARAEALIEYRRPFDLANGPLFHIALLKLGPQEHILLLTMHHIVADGGSLNVFLGELGALYTRFSAGMPSPLPPLTIQYADFARWQQQWLEGGELERQLGYWRNRLAGAPPAIDLPTDRPRPPIQTSRGAMETRVVPPAIADAVQSISNREGVTPYMTYLAAFQALLHRYTCQDDLLIGTPVSNRNRVEVEGLIGCFVNTLVVRSTGNGQSSFREFLAQTREEVVQALAHQELPFESLVESLELRRDPSRTPLFQVMFTWQVAPTAVQLPGLRLQALSIDRGTAMFDLTLVVTDDDGHMSVSAEYNTDLFDAATIRRMLLHFEFLLDHVTAHPDEPIVAAPLMEDAERQRLLVEWNETALEIPGGSVADAVARQAAARPDSIAVEDAAGRTLTYRDLDRAAGALAGRLVNAGTLVGDCVGLLVDRSMETAIGLLGILKAGAAYVPIDPDLPAERVRFLAADAGLRTLVSPKGRTPDVPPELALVPVDAALTDASASVAVPPDSAAYVIYTSGSTGTPKGVVVSHRNLLNLCAGAIERYGFDSADRVLQFTSLSFDVAAEEIFPTWLCGGTVVLRPAGPVASGAELLQYVEERKLTVLELPTSYWHELTADLQDQPRPLPTTLRLTIVGGEAARPLAAAAWKALAGQTRWINAYGPTETTVTCVAFEPPPGFELPQAAIPIGRPFPNTRAYVLDEANRPSPIGLPGELCIAGEGVALGYLNRPDLTALRFTDDPFVAGGRMYRTGDRARWRADGQLEFLGRLDNQVKVRGYRIEPAEIEAALTSLPEIRSAAVITRIDESGQQQLIAFYCCDEPLDSTALAAQLRQRLPEYMIPAAFVALHEMPMTAGGKIDRRALPQPAFISRSAEYVEPRTPTERRIVEVWQELFHHERIGVEDNFFDIGGHSLMAVQLASRMSRALGRDIAVKAIILFPTIASLADAFDRNLPGLSRSAASDDGKAGGAWLANLGSFITIERRPLLDLAAANEIAPVQSAAIGYLPASILHYAGVGADEIVHRWCGNRPIVSGIYEMGLGRIATVLIPRFDNQLYDDQAGLVATLKDALGVARQLGAETASLTGLLPSATDYGRALAEAIAGEELPRITTGHAATAAAVALAVRRILDETGRGLPNERVAFLGLGSIGSSAARLIVETMPHPAEILLCDLFSKRKALEDLAQQLRTASYNGPIRIVETREGLPDEIYNATLYVGAVNVPDILDVDRLPAGALLVDDSAPHCFRTDKALRRLRIRGDILFTEGGTLWAPEPIRQLVHMPEELEPLARTLPQDILPVHDPRQITGCIVSGLLATRFEHLKPTVGQISPADALSHFRSLAELGFRASPLHCDGYLAAREDVARFRDRFGAATPDRAATGGFDWFAEVQLDPSIDASGLEPPAGDPKAILLTGATGFLGAFLLDDLLRRTPARIYCLARADGEAEALKRIRRNLDQYSIDPGSRADRIVPLAGDLAQPRFGLAAERFAALAADIDAIFHNGAQVHFLHPYSTLKPANVLGTHEVLRLATTGRLKPVQFVSTLSVLAGISHGRAAFEDDRNDHPEELENGYSQSKWVAERLVWAAHERGVPVSIFRPGRIVWHSRTGALNHDDVFTRALRACIQLGAVPALDATLEMTPVDYVSAATVALGLKSSAWGRAYHLFNREFVRLTHLLDWVRAAGYPLEVMPPEQWLARVNETASHDAQDALAGLLPLLANGVPFLSGDAEPGTIPGPSFDGRNAQAALAGGHVESPAIGPETVAVYLGRLVSEGLMAPPQSRSPRKSPATNGRTGARSSRPRTQGTK